MKTPAPFDETQTEAGLPAPTGSAAIQPVEIAAVIMLRLCMYGLVWWFDWRLGMAWVCHAVIADFQKDFKARKQPNAKVSDPAQ